ncbi:hypothetical protein K1719_004580 [Acacia pycnantha]|nr:hypothetical protein K1719_004580 [Acacia pycnantha]
MDSSATLTTHHHHPKPLPKHLDSARKQPPPPRSCRRTPSFSSSSSSYSPYNSSSSLESVLYCGGADDNDGDPSPYSPLRFSGGCGVPFSWEHLPGIPKKQTSFKKKLHNIHQESSMELLPLPPPTNNNNNTTSSYNYKKKKKKNSLERDPFFAAMVECSKGDEEEEDNHHHGRGSKNNNNKVSRSISDRFGFVNLYSSCKNASAVSESIIYLPSSRRSRTNYQHFSRRRSL